MWGSTNNAVVPTLSPAASQEASDGTVSSRMPPLVNPRKGSDGAVNSRTRIVGLVCLQQDPVINEPAVNDTAPQVTMELGNAHLYVQQVWAQYILIGFHFPFGVVIPTGWAALLWVLPEHRTTC